ncbi:MAG: hypothetical protein ACK4UU_06525, partial [Fimbriimonadales bacterium]
MLSPSVHSNALGANFAYFITPSTSLAEAFGRHCGRLRTESGTGRQRYAIVQAEDELASIGMVIGA